jgi:hypothetical protein
MVRPQEVDFGESGAAKNVMGVVVDMPDGVAVGDGTSVERSVVTAWTPAVVLLLDEMQG